MITHIIAHIKTGFVEVAAVLDIANISFVVVNCDCFHNEYGVLLAAHV